MTDPKPIPLPDAMRGQAASAATTAQEPAPAAAPDAPAAIKPVTIKLKRPIETHQGPVHELTLKDPGAEVVLKHGLPYKQKFGLDDDRTPTGMEVEFDMAKMAYYVEAMTGIDTVSLGQMSAIDMISCANAIFNLLHETAGN